MKKKFTIRLVPLMMGLVVFLGIHIPVNAENNSVKELNIKVLTYNTHLFEGTLATLVMPSLEYKDKERLQGICNYLSKCNADLITLQEVWSDTNKNKIKDTLKTKYPYTYIDNKGFLSMGSGIIVLSKYPLEDMSYYEYPLRPELNEDNLAAKGTITGTVVTPLGKIRLGTTHAYTNTGGPSQSNIKALCDNTIKKDMPALMLGDFNVHKEDRSVTDSICNGYKAYDIWPLTHPNYQSKDNKLDPVESLTIDNCVNKCGIYFSPGADPNSTYSKDRIDYIYVKSTSTENGLNLVPKSSSVIKDWQINVDGSNLDCSDHYPLEATFVLKKV